MKIFAQIFLKYILIVLLAWSIYGVCYLIGSAIHEKRYCGGLCFYSAITTVVVGAAVSVYIIIGTIGEFFQWNKVARIILNGVIVITVLLIMNSTRHPLRFYLIGFSFLSSFPIQYLIDSD